MAQVQTKSNKLYVLRIMTVKHRIRGWSYELQDVFLKINRLKIPRVNI